MDLSDVYILLGSGEHMQVTLHGIIRGEIEAPYSLASVKPEDGCAFVLVDVVGVEVHSKVRCKYRIRGSVVVFVGKSILEDMKKGYFAYSFTGPLRLARDGRLVSLVYFKLVGNYWTLKSVEYNRFRFSSGDIEYADVLSRAEINNGVLPAVELEKGYRSNYVIANKGVTFKSKRENRVEDNLVVGAVKDTEDTDSIVKKVEEVKNELSKDCGGSILGKSENYDIIKKAAEDSDAKVRVLLKSIESKYGKHSLKDDLIVCANELRKNWKQSSDVFKKAVEKVFEDYTEKNVIADILTVGKVIMLSHWVGEIEDSSNKFYMELYKRRELVYYAMLDNLLEFRGRLLNIVKDSETSKSFYSVMKANPYLLVLLDSRFKVVDLDKLAMFYGVKWLTDTEVGRVRNIVYMHDMLCDSSGGMFSSYSTCVIKNDLRFQVGVSLTNTQYGYLDNSGIVVKEQTLNHLMMLNPRISREYFALPRDGWVDVSKKKFLRLGYNISKVIQDYVDSGLGVVFKIDGREWLADFTFVKKEVYIYEKLQQLCKQSVVNLDKKDIQDCVESFEKMKSLELGIPNFRLEDRQAKALELLSNGVLCLTGPAGSGKTTTAEALVYAAENLLGIDRDEIMFCAPTGKAANRLKEVVKRKTRTIHSLFGVGVDVFSFVSGMEKDKNVGDKKSEIKVLVVDESSMITTNLMYAMLSKVDNKTRIFFLGDKEQLPPIGFGKPFADLLKFMPCVVLNVTKRASDKSGITSNAKEIITNSCSAKTMEDLKTFGDFKIINCGSNGVLDAVNYVLSICSYHAHGVKRKDFTEVSNLVGEELTADDIQVVTPVNKYNFKWGSSYLNGELQNIFNPRVKSKFIKYNSSAASEELGIEFRIGDKVIHTKNNAKKVRLIKIGENMFDIEESTGVMNGDVGKVEGIYKYSDMTFPDEQVEKQIRKEYYGKSNTAFLAVKYKDVDTELGSELEYIILYRYTMGRSAEEIKFLEDLLLLELAYALTVHKLQGSQAKLIVCVMFNAGKVGFISRNMIYTAITRAQKACYLIGDITGSGSIINTGRLIEQTSQRNTMLDLV